MPHTLLLIDDDHVFLEATKGFLEQNGFQVLTATSWVGFTNAFYGGPAPPEIVLFDINLGPTVPGDRLLFVFKEAKKKLASAQKTKLIIFSGLPEAEVQNRARLCGADGYIMKSTLSVRSGAAFLDQLRSFLY